MHTLNTIMCIRIYVHTYVAILIHFCITIDKQFGHLASTEIIVAVKQWPSPNSGMIFKIKCNLIKQVDIF